MRRAAGLEAAVVDHGPMEIASLAPGDTRVFTANVAGTAALVVSKLFKLAEREGQPGRLLDKDAHDLYRLLAAVPTAELAASFARLMVDAVAGAPTAQALEWLDRLFAQGPSAPGSRMAGRAEAGVGAPEVVSASVAVLAGDLLQALGGRGREP